VGERHWLDFEGPRGSSPSLEIASLPKARKTALGQGRGRREKGEIFAVTSKKNKAEGRGKKYSLPPCQGRLATVSKKSLWSEGKTKQEGEGLSQPERRTYGGVSRLTQVKVSRQSW